MPTLTAIATGTDALQFNQMAFRQNTAANTPADITWDELRVGTGWAAVTPPAAPIAPVLTISRSGTNAVISWPTNNSSGFVLQGISGFNDPDGWTTVTNSATINGADFNVIVPTTGANRFFRLKK